MTSTVYVVDLEWWLHSRPFTFGFPYDLLPFMIACAIPTLGSLWQLLTGDYAEEGEWVEDEHYDFFEGDEI